MFAKNLLPPAVRESLRRKYHRLQRSIQKRRNAVFESSFWPKPATWHEIKNQLADETDSSRLYQIAAKEFGILQVEEEIVPFLDYVADHNPVVIGEIGLKHGGNSFMFLRKLQHVSLYLGMDLVLENINKLKFYRRDSQQLHILKGNSQLPAVVNKAKSHLAGKQFDFLFIDGDHEYDGVLADLVEWYPLVKPGGLIAFHDIVPDEEAKTGVRPEGTLLWVGGVYKLWANIKPHFEHKEFVKDWNQGGFGIGVIKKKDQSVMDPSLVASLRNTDATTS